MSPHDLVHRIKFMEEIKMPINETNFRSLKLRMNRSVSALVKTKHIKSDVFEATLSTLDLPSHLYTHLPTDIARREMSFNHVWKTTVETFLRWKIDLTEESFEKSRSKVQFYTKSLRVMSETVSFLKNELQLKNNVISAKLSIVLGVVDLYRDILNHKKPILGMSNLDLIKKHPEILLKPFTETLLIDAIIQCVNLSSTNFSKNCFTIFRFTPNVVLERIDYFLKKTSPLDLILSPNNQNLITGFKTCKRNLEKYEAEFGPCDYLPSLWWREEMKHGVNTSTRQYFAQFLEFFLNLTEGEVYKGMHRMKFTKYPRYYEIKLNFRFLVEKEFSIDNIKKAYHLLMYPNSLLIEEYENLDREIVEKKDVDIFLQLLLYRVHKKYVNFGGALM